MTAATYTAQIRRDGALAVPRLIREQLSLQPGQTVEVVVRPVEGKTAARAREENPLLKIIGIAGPGGSEDAAENHDQYLYGRP